MCERQSATSGGCSPTRIPKGCRVSGVLCCRCWVVFGNQRPGGIVHGQEGPRPVGPEPAQVVRRASALHGVLRHPMAPVGLIGWRAGGIWCGCIDRVRPPAPHTIHSVSQEVAEVVPTVYLGGILRQPDSKSRISGSSLRPPRYPPSQSLRSSPR